MALRPLMWRFHGPQETLMLRSADRVLEAQLNESQSMRVQLMIRMIRMIRMCILKFERHQSCQAEVSQPPGCGFVPTVGLVAVASLPHCLPSQSLTP